MQSSADYAVSLRHAAPRAIAAVPARMSADRIPSEFMRHLDQVYAACSNGLQLDGQNIFLYRHAIGHPGELEIEFGVGLAGQFVPVGAVHRVELPAGEVATTTHLGGYGGLRAAHEAVLAWCRARSYPTAGPHWEVYGHWTEGEPPRTDVYYLLEPTGDESR